MLSPATAATGSGTRPVDGRSGRTGHRARAHRKGPGPRCGRVRPAGARPDQPREQGLAIGFVLEDGREQAIHPLVPLVLGTERAEAEAGHGGVDLGRIGEAAVNDQEADGPGFAAVGILERDEAPGEIVEGIIADRTDRWPMGRPRDTGRVPGR